MVKRRLVSRPCSAGGSRLNISVQASLGGACTSLPRSLQKPGSHSLPELKYGAEGPLVLGRLIEGGVVGLFARPGIRRRNQILNPHVPGKQRSTAARTWPIGPIVSS